MVVYSKSVLIAYDSHAKEVDYLSRLLSVVARLPKQ